VVVAAESVAPTALDVLQPQEVPVLTPAVMDRESHTAADELRSRLADPVKSANGAKSPGRLRPRLLLAVLVSESESVTESAVPTVLV
jgi:hypothetical protein